MSDATNYVSSHSATGELWQRCKEQAVEIDCLRNDLHMRKQEVVCLRNSQSLELANAKAEIERLRAEHFEKIEQLGQCRRLLREAADRVASQGGYFAGWWTEWLEAARAAGGDDDAL